MGWVYLLEAKIYAGDRMSLVKIGLSNKPDFHDRTSSIQEEWQRERGVQVIILAIEECENSFEVEAQLHQKFKAHRIDMAKLRQALGGNCSGDSEWFLVPGNLINSNNGIKYSVDRLSDHPNLGGDFPWITLGTCLLALCVVLSIGRSQQNPIETLPAKTIAAKGFKSANIRSSPNGQIVGTVKNGTPVSILKKQGAWCQISDKQWIFCELIN